MDSGNQRTYCTRQKKEARPLIHFILVANPNYKTMENCSRMTWHFVIWLGTVSEHNVYSKLTMLLLSQIYLWIDTLNKSF